MKTVGSILKEAREAQHIDFDTVEKTTRIRRKFLEAIERDEYSLLPSPLYAKGFVKNYAHFLGLDSVKVMAFFRRQTDDIPHGTLLPKAQESIGTSMVQLTPSRFIAILLVAMIGIFLLYFGLQYFRLQQAPTLIIDQPKNESVVTERKVDIFGATDTDATVTINGVTTLVRQDGKFFTQVTLESGVNTITIIATSRYGKTKTEIRKVGLQQ